MCCLVAWCTILTEAAYGTGTDLLWEQIANNGSAVVDSWTLHQSHHGPFPLNPAVVPAPPPPPPTPPAGPPAGKQWKCWAGTGIHDALLPQCIDKDFVSNVHGLSRCQQVGDTADRAVAISWGANTTEAEIEAVKSNNTDVHCHGKCSRSLCVFFRSLREAAAQCSSGQRRLPT